MGKFASNSFCDVLRTLSAHLPSQILTRVAIAAGLVVVGASAHADTRSASPTMAIAGREDVSSTGAFAYRIPIVVPHGTAGMQPVLSLNYSSSDPDGHLGLGWSLNGMPTITRCPRTIAEDNVHGSINYDVNDRYCYEGKRLVAISGSYGSEGAEYRLEVDDFTKFLSHGTAGSGSNAGPAWFEIHTKAGLTIYCGYSEDSDNPGNNSRFIVSASGPARAWGTEKVFDNAGNYWIAKYVNDMTNGESYPTEIDYAGNDAAGLAPYASVQFSYTPKTHIVPAYQAGYLQQTTQLLQYIKTYVSGAQVFNYTLTYTPASSGASHDELHTLQQCDGSTACFPVMTFGWQGTKDNPPISPPVTPPLNWSAGIGDFNGDGILDLVPDFLNSASPNCTAYIQPGMSWSSPYFGQQDGSFLLGNMTISGSPACLLTTTVGSPATHDINGDGFTDLSATINGGPTSGILINNRANGFTLVTGAACCENVGDYNGDGMTDAFHEVSKTTAQFGYSNGDGTFNLSAILPWNWVFGGVVAPGDFNGDGCTDVGYNSTVTLTCDQFGQQFASPCSNPTVGDFNGDGISDQICNGTLYLSTGKGFVAQSSSTPAAAIVGDWNGDGKADLLGGDGSVYLSTGTGFTKIGTLSGFTPTGVIQIADWNNDGAEDIWVVDPSYATTGSQYLLGYIPELMTSIDNGIGRSTVVAYDRLNKNGTFYAKTNSASYPTADFDGAMYVVSSISESDGVGGTHQLTYAYSGAQQDLHGLGFLGFTAITATDVPTNITQTTTFRLDPPYTPLISSQITTVPKTGGGTVTTGSFVSNYQKLSLGTGTDGVARWFVETCSTVQSGTDEDFSTGTTYAMPTVTTVFTYDFDTNGSCSGGSMAGYGNVTAAVETTVGTATSTKTTSNQYYPANTTKWFVGQIEESDVTRIVGTSSITRHTSYSYNNSGLLASEITEPSRAATDPLRIEDDYVYDPYGNRTSVKVKACVWSATSCASKTRTTGYAFDVPTYHGAYLTKQTNALSQNEGWAYDLRFGAVAGHTDLNGLVTSWSYNTLGQETQETRPDNTKTLYSYYYCTSAPCGGLPTSISAIPEYAQYFSYALPERTGDNSQYAPISIVYYDSLNRPLGVDFEGFSSSTCDNLATACWARQAVPYDSLGRAHELSRPYFLSGGTPKWTVYTYDILNRVVRVDFPDMSKTTFAYQGPTTSSTNDKSQTTTTFRNDQGLIQTVTDAASKQTNYVYDAYGDLLSVKDPNSNTTSYTYDIRGRRLSASDPDMGSWAYVFDGYSELYSQTDAKLQMTALTYDSLGRVKTRTEPDMASTFTYDVGTNGLGHLTSETTGSNFERDYVFADSAGRPSSTTTTIDGTAYSYSYTYQSNGQLATITYPSGFSAYQSFTTNLGYLYEVRDGNLSGQLLWRGSSRDAEDHLLTQLAGNNVTTTQTFDPNTGLPLTIKAGANSSVANSSYQYDTLGNLTQRIWSKDSTGTALATENACYDSLNRLIQYNVGGLCTGTGRTTVGYYGADGAIGDITQKNDVCAGVHCFSYGQSAGPHALTAINGTYNGVNNPTFTYDANGNMTSGAGRTIVPTSFNMAGAITVGSLTTTFTYGSDHQRAKMVASGTTPTTIDYLNDPVSGVLEEKQTVGPGVTWHDYLQADGPLVGERFCIGSTAPCTGTPTFNYFTLDHLGSVSEVADSSGNVLERLSYDPWGERRNIDGTPATCNSISSSTSRGFTSQEMMDNLCLINFNARVYEPGLGRFMSADRIVQDMYSGQSLNRYSYVENKPLSAVDPSGYSIDPRVLTASMQSNAVPESVVVVAPHASAPPSPAPDLTNIRFNESLANLNEAIGTVGPGMSPISGVGGPILSPAISSTPTATGLVKTTAENGKTSTDNDVNQSSDQSDARSNSEPNEGDTKKDANGSTYTYQNGKWIETVIDVGKKLAPPQSPVVQVQCPGCMTLASSSISIQPYSHANDNRFEECIRAAHDCLQTYSNDKRKYCIEGEDMCNSAFSRRKPNTIMMDKSLSNGTMIFITTGGQVFIVPDGEKFSRLPGAK